MVDPPGDEEDRAVLPRACGLLVRAREHDDLDRALQVLERRHGHRLARLRHDHPDPGHDPADDDSLAVQRLVAQVAAIRGHVVADPIGHLAHRVLGQVQPEQLLFPAQSDAHRLLGHGRQRALERRGILARADVEQRCLAGQPVALGGLAGRDRIVEPGQHLGRMTERVERPHPGQRLEHLAVGEPQVDPRAEVGQRAERPALVAGGDDRLDRALADVLDREQPEPDRATLDGELEMARVDVGRQDRDGHPAALGDRGRDLLLVRPEGGQHRGHVLDRVVRLQVRGLVGDEPVARRVGLVEAVALERLEGGKDRVDDLRLDAALDGLGDELLALGAQHR